MLKIQHLWRGWRQRLIGPRLEIRGVPRNGGSPAMIIAFGAEALEYATLYGQCVFDESTLQIRETSVFIPWRFLCEIWWKRRPQAFIVIALPGPWKQWARWKCDARSPIFIGHRVDLAGGWDAVISRMGSRRRGQIRQFLRQPSHNLTFSRELADFDTFYDALYLPSVRQRHGPLARPIDRSAALEHFRSGGVLMHMEAGRCVAAALISLTPDVFQIARLAVAQDEHGQDIVRHAHLGLYVESLRLAIAAEKRWLDLTGTKPFPSDGLFMYKNSYGSTVSSMGPHIGQVCLFLPADTSVAAGLLTLAPILQIGADQQLGQVSVR